MKIIRNTIFLLCLISSVSVSAQTAVKDSAMNQSMTIERDFSPIVRDANKIDKQPEIPELKIKKTAASYSDWVAGNITSSAIGKMAAGQVIAEEEPLRRGFLEVSGGNYYTGNVKAGIIFCKDFSMNIDGRYTQGKRPISDDPAVFYPVIDYRTNGRNDVNWDSRYLGGNLKLNYNHSFTNGMNLLAHAGASGRRYNLFTLLDNNVYQTNWRAFADLALDFESLMVKLSYQHSQLKISDMQENSLHLKGTYGLYDEDSWQLKFGLEVGAEFGIEKPFNIMPEVEYSMLLDSRKRFYINASGGVKGYGLYNLMTKMPFLLPSSKYSSEVTAIDAVVGYEDNSRGVFKWGVYAEAKEMMDRLEVVMSTPHIINNVLVNTDRETLNNLTLVGVLQYKKSFEFKAGGYFDADCNKYLKIKGALDFNSDPRFGDEMLNIDLHFTSNPIKKLFLDLGFEGKINRKMYLYYDKSYYINDIRTAEYKDVIIDEGATKEKIDLGNIYNLNFRADFKLNDSFTIFAVGNNLLNVKTSLFAGIPAKGINFYGGFIWKF